MLSNNNISDIGAVALAQALHHNSTLRQLNLSGNNGIGEEGTHQLVMAVTVNRSDTRQCDVVLPKRCEAYVRHSEQWVLKFTNQIYTSNASHHNHRAQYTEIYITEDERQSVL